jgi:hypothetical protein
MSDLNKILADVKNEEDTDPFATLETETPTESQPVEEPKVEEPVVGDLNTPTEPKGEENVPFHQHPRWIAREQDLADERAKREELEAQVALLSERTTPSDTSIPQWFQELYGDNPTAYAAYAAHEQERKEELKRELIEEQQHERQAEEQEQQRWLSWVDTEYAKLEADGHKFDRNELGKFILDYPVTDSVGNLDFKKSYDLFAQTKATAPTADPARSQARKQLAATATATTTGESKKKDYLTPSDLRNMSWHAL